MVSRAALAWWPESIGAEKPTRVHAVDGESLQLTGTLWLAHSGIILDCAGPIVERLGYDSAELAGRHVSLVLPDFLQTKLLDNYGVNSRLAFRCRCGVPFRGITKEGQERLLCVYVNLISAAGDSKIALILAEPKP